MYIFFTGLTRRRSAADLGATPSFHRLLSRAVTIDDPWEPLGTLWDPLGIPWGSLGDPLGRPWGPLGTSWGPLGDLLRTLKDPLVTLWGPLKTPWRLPGELRGRLGMSLGPLGDHFGVILDTLGSFWGQLGAPKDSHRLSKWPWETSWGPLRIIFEAPKAFTKRFAAICQNLQIYRKVLQNSRSMET